MKIEFKNGESILTMKNTEFLDLIHDSVLNDNNPSWWLKFDYNELLEKYNKEKK